MKLTVAALALLVVGASYADMAAANKTCWHGKKAKARCDNYVAKHWGSKCEGTGFGTKNPQYCAIPGALPPNPSPAPTPWCTIPICKWNFGIKLIHCCCCCTTLGCIVFRLIDAKGTQQKPIDH